MKSQAIIERELIVSGKSWKTYLFRLIPPALTLLILGSMAWAGDFGKLVKNGQFLFFVTLSVAAFYAGISGFLASSTLSHEREASTLGLLFLTPLKSRDVILGKFISAIHLHLQSILTLLPLEAMAFVLGGVSVSAFLGMNCFILCWLFYSTSAGICISSFSPNERVSGVLTLIFTGFITLGICALISLMGFWLKEWNFFSSYDQVKTWHQVLFPFTPVGIFGILMASLGVLPEHPGPTILYRCLVGMLFLLIQGVLFLWLATLITSVVWRKQPSSHKGLFRKLLLTLYQRVNLGSRAHQERLRLRLLAAHPYDWICGRSRIPTVMLWILWLAAVVPLGYLFHLSLKPLHTPLNLLGQIFPSLSLLLPSLVSAPLCFVACFMLKIWTTYVVSMRIQRDASTGMLPLILSTHISPRDLFASQIRILAKRIWVPLLATFAIVAHYVISYSVKAELPPPPPMEIPLPTLSRFTLIYIPLTYGVVLLVADLITLCFVSMSLSLRAKKLQTAFISSLTTVLAVPWLVGYISFVPWMNAQEISSFSSSPWTLVALTLAALLYDGLLCYGFYRHAQKRMRG